MKNIILTLLILIGSTNCLAHGSSHPKEDSSSNFSSIVTPDQATTVVSFESGTIRLDTNGDLVICLSESNGIVYNLSNICHHTMYPKDYLKKKKYVGFQRVKGYFFFYYK